MHSSLLPAFTRLQAGEFMFFIPTSSSLREDVIQYKCSRIGFLIGMTLKLLVLNDHLGSITELISYYYFIAAFVSRCIDYWSNHNVCKLQFSNGMTSTDR